MLTLLFWFCVKGYIKRTGDEAILIFAAFPMGTDYIIMGLVLVRLGWINTI